MGAGELLFHLCKRCSDDVVMMHVRTDGLDGVEPQAVNQIEVAGCEGWRMGAEVIRVGASAPVIDDESNVKGFGLVGSLPRLAQQAGLILGRERRRFAHVHVGRAKTNDGADDRVDDVAGGDDEQAHRTTDALGEGDNVREQPPLVRRGRALASRLLADVDVEQPRGHDHDVSIARRLKRRDHVSERMRIADRHQHVSRTSLDLVERELRGEQQVERVCVCR